MKLVVGLGNPGKAYNRARHNLGFMCLNYFAQSYNLSFSQRRAHCQIAQGEIEDIPVILAKPLTYVNNSGKAVKALIKEWKIPLQDIIIIHDDLDLPLGRIRIRAKGSAGGHKGIQSIIASLGSQAFVRIKVGIGHPQEGDVISFVLSPFSPEEEEMVKSAIELAGQALLCLLKEGVVTAMNKYNRRLGKP
jgi:PTH1 family peptidyl-tRNA hydrolase